MERSPRRIWRYYISGSKYVIAKAFSLRFHPGKEMVPVMIWQHCPFPLPCMWKWTRAPLSGWLQAPDFLWITLLSLLEMNFILWYQIWEQSNASVKTFFQTDERGCSRGNSWWGNASGEVVYIAWYVCPGGTRAGLLLGDIIHRNGMRDMYCARPRRAQKTILDAPM